MYGDDGSSEDSEGGEEGPEADEVVALRCADVRLLTWNASLQTQCGFLVEASKTMDVMARTKKVSFFI